MLWVGIKLCQCSGSQPLREFRKHAITILILHGGHGFPALVAQQLVPKIEHLVVVQIYQELTPLHLRSLRRPVESHDPRTTQYCFSICVQNGTNLLTNPLRDFKVLIVNAYY